MSSAFSSSISEVYFAGNPQVLPSGRRPKIKHYIRLLNSTASFDDRAYDDDLLTLIRLFNTSSVRCNLLLNFEGMLTPNMLHYIDSLVDYGVSAVTVGNTSMLEQICRRYGNDFGIQNSVYIPAPDLLSVTGLLDAGVNILLVPPDFNHDFDFLHRLALVTSSRGCELKIMVNEGCVEHCPHRAEDLSDAQSYPIELAMQDYLNNPQEIRTLSSPCRAYMERQGLSKTNYIHPNDVSAYAGFKPLLKIVGRSFSSDTVLIACQAYASGQYQGDLRLLVENFKHAIMPVQHGSAGRAVFKPSEFRDV